MKPSATDPQLKELVAQIIPFSPYRRKLVGMEPDITRIALMNHQIRQALEQLLARREQAGRTLAPLNRQDLGPDARLFSEFLEYIHFASPAFLTRVGEGPLARNKEGLAHD
ncbi:hypothetical protein ACT6QH_00875 [Xanthobacter sp. TB0139]|uniref:hypothetical protein n=1 Tax=Xanthobacter sp. TB0139 TaxID=3459178 RepID=UPI004038FD7F